MALAMNTTLTVSCEASEEQSGPTLVHSTGVQNYRIQPELIRVLQESCTNDKLSDHEKGVQCLHPIAHIIQVFEKAGFTVTTQTTAGSRKLWMLTKTDEGGSNSGGSSGQNPSGGNHGQNPDDNETGENEGDDEGEGEGEGEGEEEGEEEEEEEEE